MVLSLKIAVRDWDHLTPLLLGEVGSDKLDLVVDRVGTLLPNVAHSSEYDAAEMSFTRYALLKAEGDQAVTGIPHFIMRAFRHRCVITRKDSPYTTFRSLNGKRIGMTGWQDSGNIWTRAALRRDGVEIEKTNWFAGRLTKDHPILDRIGSYGVPGRIEPTPGEWPMDELLKADELDAICTPFMPEGFFRADSPFRHVLPDLRSAEKGYFDEVGFVPGIHLLAFKTEIIARYPWVAEEVSSLLGRAQELWLQKRRKYADTTPWLIEEFGAITRSLPEDWSRSGMAANRSMIDSFGLELFEQGIVNRQLVADELFQMAS